LKTALFVGLGIVGALYLYVFGRAVARGRARGGTGEDSPRPTPLGLAIGFVTNFFDTLGIGSFATTTALFKLNRLVADERIPGTLNVGHTPPTIAQALIFIAIVSVDVTTLTLMIAAAVLGSWSGAGIVASWPRRKVQIGMGIALLVAATLFLLAIFKIAPGGGEALALSGTKLGVGLAGNFALGVLMQLGIGLYGPCLILVSLLGMNPQAAFPIMMGSCAFLMPVGSVKFIEHGRYSLRESLGLAIGGVPAVLIAVYIVKSMPLEYLRWLVVIVVVYAAVSMLHSAITESKAPAKGTVA
jgi:uncharacterized membrane protein YfcA